MEPACSTAMSPWADIRIPLNTTGNRRCIQCRSVVNTQTIGPELGIISCSGAFTNQDLLRTDRFIASVTN